MRIVFALGATLFSVVTVAPAMADDMPAPQEMPAPQDMPAPQADEAGKPVLPETREARLDALFSALKRERNEKAAERIAQRIWQEWNQSGSATVDLMMQWSQKAVEGQKYDVALDFLDQVVTLKPDYAEGWNRRATVHYLMKNYAKSMADIDRTLRLEPRHFGAMAGIARIMSDTGRKAAALEAWQRVLAVYPMMRPAQDEVGRLSEDLTGEGI